MSIFVTCFKYLGHMIEHTLSDDCDINRELKCLFVRANLLRRRFGVAQLKSNFGFLKPSACFHDIGMWRFYRVGSLQKNLLLRM